MTLTVSYNSKEVEQYLKKLPETSFEKAKKVFATSVLAANREVKSNATTKLNVRTGALRRSIGQSVKGMNLDELRASIFSGSSGGKPVVYAPIHEFGGTVTAKKAYTNVPGGPYLNIPIADNLTPAGVMRMTAGMVFNQGGYLFKSKSGKWFVAMNDKLMFVLVKEVTIKPQLGMRDAAEKQVPIILTELKKIIGE